MAGLTSPGIGSGLDINGLVTQLMTVERQPLADLDKKEASHQATLSAWGTLGGALSSLQSAASALTSGTLFAGFSAGVSDATVLSASATSGATAGNYAISVTALATANTIRSNNAYATTDTFSSGTLAIKVGSTTTSVAINAGNYTLAGMAQAINNANAGVNATVVFDGTSNRLVLNANSSGAANSISITATQDGVTTGGQTLTGLDSVAGNIVQVQAGTDANFSINGLAMTRSSNTVTDAITGVSLTLTKGSSGGVPATTTLSVARDTATPARAINAFVKAYNDLNKSLHDLSAYDPATKQGGVLLGDSAVGTAQMQLNAQLFRDVNGVAGGARTLSDIGISVQKGGALLVDSVKLQAALADPHQDIASLFTQTTAGNQGIAVSFNNLAQQMLGADGLIASRTGGINRSIKDVDNQRTALNAHLAIVEQSYRAQFSALDMTVTRMKQTADYLTQQLASLSSLSNASK